MTVANTAEKSPGFTIKKARQRPLTQTCSTYITAPGFMLQMIEVYKDV